MVILSSFKLSFVSFADVEKVDTKNGMYHILVLIPPIYFCPENIVCFLSLIHYIQVHSRLDFIMKANTMNPDQTAPEEQSDLGVCNIGLFRT